MPVTESDVAALTVLLGRAPRGDFEIVVRDASGAPMVIRNSPLLDDGTPMPTRFWLVDPELVTRVASRTLHVGDEEPDRVRSDIDRGDAAHGAASDARAAATHRPTGSSPPARCHA